jgi:shikimate kinase
MKKIALTGFMGAGKTSLGKELSLIKKLPFIDLDYCIEEKENKKISHLIDGSEPYFRSLETAYLAYILKKQDEFILSLGGGTFTFDINIDLLKKYQVEVWFLKRSEEFIYQQWKLIKETRPLLKHKSWEETRDLYKRRMPKYEQADYIIETDDWAIENWIK